MFQQLNRSVFFRLHKTQISTTVSEILCIGSKRITTGVHSNQGLICEKVIRTSGCASFEIRIPHPQHPPLAESTQNLHKPQHLSTGHSIASGFGFGFGFGFGLGSGGRRQAPRPTKPQICTWYSTWYQVFRYSSSSSSSSSTFHRKRISNSRTRGYILIRT